MKHRETQTRNDHTFGLRSAETCTRHNCASFSTTESVSMIKLARTSLPTCPATRCRQSSGRSLVSSLVASRISHLYLYLQLASCNRLIADRNRSQKQSRAQAEPSIPFFRKVLRAARRAPPTRFPFKLGGLLQQFAFIKNSAQGDLRNRSRSVRSRTLARQPARKGKI